MSKRFVSVYCCHLETDWFVNHQPALRGMPLVLRKPVHGKMVIAASSRLAQEQGVYSGTALADARVLVTSLQVIDEKPGLAERLLHKMACWCIRFTPIAAVDGNDGLILDATGCPHLWGGEEAYLKEIVQRFKNKGYTVRAAMADTPGAAWAMARHERNNFISKKGKAINSLLSLPVIALRLDDDTVDRLCKLGLKLVKDLIRIPRTALRRRFGEQLLVRLDQATGLAEEVIQPVQPIVPYQERLPCMEAILTLSGIEIALQQLLDTLCKRLQKEAKGLRKAIFKCYRADGKVQRIEIGTHWPSHHAGHLFKLFELKFSSIEPEPGIELFVLEAPVTEAHIPVQEKIWETKGGLPDPALAELLDRIGNSTGADSISRYLPDEHYWPERSIKKASSLKERATTEWKNGGPRPIRLLPYPESIDVTAPVPDYPPMNFRYKGKLHKVIKADGPERIEQEWWLQQGQHRDYYCVEDENGCRYWLFRSGHYADRNYQWYLHGFFA